MGWDYIPICTLHGEPPRLPISRVKKQSAEFCCLHLVCCTLRKGLTKLASKQPLAARVSSLKQHGPKYDVRKKKQKVIVIYSRIRICIYYVYIYIEYQGPHSIITCWLSVSLSLSDPHHGSSRLCFDCISIHISCIFSNTLSGTYTGIVSEIRAPGSGPMLPTGARGSGLVVLTAILRISYHILISKGIRIS